MNLWDKVNHIANLAFGAAKDYKGLFNNSTVKQEGEKVLHDLAKFCGAYEFDIPHNQSDISSIELARRVGRLEVYQHIQKNLRMTENDKNKIAQRLFELEQYQQQQQNKEFI